MRLFNIDKIVSIQTIDISEDKNRFKFKKEIKFLGIIFRKSGFYDTVFGEFVGYKIPKGRFIDNNKVYMEPRVLITFIDGSAICKNFTTIEEAIQAKNNITKTGKWIDG